MRAGLSTVQQTLASEAASVLNQSIAEASRRNHGQTTPLHVAATLLSAPSGFLRQACIRSHPNSSHPLQCRALELCFSVALDRLPTAQNMAAPGAEPPISNALMAALKRAQANQRRGCPEQQQQPLLAVKVELEHLIISILDDPSVSRVMREASFSSPSVKATIEQSLNNSNSSSHGHRQHHVGGGANLTFGGIGARMLSNPGQLSTLAAPQVAPLTNRSMYLNPRLQQGSTVQIGDQNGDEVKKVLEIMERTKKRNPVLVGDSEPRTVVKDFLRKIEKKELGSESIWKNVHVISMEKGIMLSDKSQIVSKIDELEGVIHNKIRNGSVILDLGDLKWLVEQQQRQQVVSETGRTVVVEMTKLLARFNGRDEGTNKLWLIGTATCETYLRCQVYHPTMENDWDLQALPITSRSPLPGLFQRTGNERIMSNPVDSLNALRSAAVPIPLPALARTASGNSSPDPTKTFCPQCSENYEKELARLVAIEKSFSNTKQEASLSSLPQWLQSAKLNNTDIGATNEQGKEPGLLSKQKTQELHKKWRDTCLHLHPNFHQKSSSDRTGPPAVSLPSLYNPSLLSRLPFQPKLPTPKPLGEALKLNMNQGIPRTQTPKPLGESLKLNNMNQGIPPSQTPKPFGETLKLNMNQDTAQRMSSPPGSPVRTDLVLGTKKLDSVPEKDREDQAKDFLGCISTKPMTKLLEKFSNALDADNYKQLLKSLMQKAWWQAEAASAVASTITQWRLGSGKRQGPRGDIWLLFTGPDRVGKKKMAHALGEHLCGANPVLICLGKRREDDESELISFRGKTAIDRIAEAVRRNPFSVIMLEDIDEADMLVRGSVKRAIERGRLTDSHGREISLGNAIFIVTGDWSTTNPEAVNQRHFVDEKKLASIASAGWQLGIVVREKSSKRRLNWSNEEDRPQKTQKEMGSGLSLDLNLSVSFPDDGSHNSSELTIDHSDDFSNSHFSITSPPHDLVTSVDDSIVFKPVESSSVQREIKKTISIKFSRVVGEDLSIEVEDDVLEKILGGLWHDRTSLEEWIDNVLGPSFDQLKRQFPSGNRSTLVARLVVESGYSNRGKGNGNGDWLPSSIVV